MNLIKVGEICKRIFGFRKAVLHTMPYFYSDVFHRKLEVNGIDTDQDDWIIGGLSLAEYCKSMRYEERNIFHCLPNHKNAVNGDAMKQCQDFQEMLPKQVPL